MNGTMKQPEDTKTLDLLGSTKPARGRPPKPDALSGAERSRRFRAARKAAGVPVGKVDRAELVALQEQLEQERQARIDAEARAAAAELELMRRK